MTVKLRDSSARSAKQLRLELEPDEKRYPMQIQCMEERALHIQRDRAAAWRLLEEIFQILQEDHPASEGSMTWIRGRSGQLPPERSQMFDSARNQHLGVEGDVRGGER